MLYEFPKFTTLYLDQTRVTKKWVYDASQTPNVINLSLPNVELI